MTKCPQCGYSEGPAQPEKSQIMNVYITSDGKRRACMNRGDQQVEAIKDGVKTTWVLESAYNKHPTASQIVPSVSPKPTK